MNKTTGITYNYYILAKCFLKQKPTLHYWSNPCLEIDILQNSPSQ